MAASLAATPDLPVRHPARFYRVETDSLPSAPAPLSDELVDLWQHATLLFYGYEWHSSAENFLYLSSIINHQFESAQCLLNAAIIYARIGDYDVASEALEAAAQADEFRPLALYLLGHIEFELGDLQASEQCFQAALAELDGQKQQFGRLGLDFTLDETKIQHNLSAFDVHHVSLDSIPDLGAAALPANSVFESPQRLPDSGYASPQSPTKSMDSAQFQQDDLDRPKQTPKTLLARRKQKLNDTPRPQNLRALEYLRDGVRWHEPMIPLKERPVVPLAPRRSTKSLGGLMRQLSTRKSTDEPKSNSQPASPRSRLLSRLVPREAKVQDDSVRDLATFIRNGPITPNHSGPALHVQTDSRDLNSGQGSGIDDHQLCSVQPHDSGNDATVLLDEHMTDEIQPPTAYVHDEDMASTHMPCESLVSQDSLDEPARLVSNRPPTPSMHSVYTEATSALGDDEASDSGNETDERRSRSSTPTHALR